MAACSVERSDKIKQWWSDPANKEYVRRRKVEEKAKRWGVTVEALMRPRVWAPVAERRRVYLGLIREGATHRDIWLQYPNEDHGVINKCTLQVFKERERLLGELI